jgi:hypothetical protein
MPEFLTIGFEAKQWMIRSSAWFLGIVPDLRSFLFPVNRDDHRIQIEDQTCRFAWQSEQVGPQAVLKPDQLSDGLRTQSFQKSSQCGLIRKTVQAKNLQKKSIVLQDFGLVDPLHPHDNCIKQSEDQFGRMILGSILETMSLQTHLDVLLEIDLFAKTMNQQHSSKVRQMTFSEENTYIPGSFGHGMQTVHLGRFPYQQFYLP